MRGGGPPRPEPIVFAGLSGRDELEDEDTDDWDIAAGEPHVGEEGDAASAVIREDFASEDGDGTDVGGVDETDMDAVPSVRASTSADGDRGGIWASVDAMKASVRICYGTRQELVVARC